MCIDTNQLLAFVQNRPGDTWYVLKYNFINPKINMLYCCLDRPPKNYRLWEFQHLYFLSHHARKAGMPSPIVIKCLDNWTRASLQSFEGTTVFCGGYRGKLLWLHTNTQ